MKNNLQLQNDVRAELAWDPRVDDKEVRVAATDGVVTLTGSVPSFAEKWAAERAAERVFGVKAVANDLAVAVPVTYQRSDTDIAQAVVDALVWDVQVPETDIKAAVSDGWITLEGDVEWRYQRDAAARAVRNLSGVARRDEQHHDHGQAGFVARSEQEHQGGAGAPGGSHGRAHQRRDDRKCRHAQGKRAVVRRSSRRRGRSVVGAGRDRRSR